jgi:hypothetical protein
VNGALFTFSPLFAQPPDNDGRVALLRRGGYSGSSGATVNALAEFSLSLRISASSATGSSVRYISRRPCLTASFKNPLMQQAEVATIEGNN